MTRNLDRLNSLQQHSLPSPSPFFTTFLSNYGMALHFFYLTGTLRTKARVVATLLQS